MQGRQQQAGAALLVRATGGGRGAEAPAQRASPCRAAPAFPRPSALLIRALRQA